VVHGDRSREPEGTVKAAHLRDRPVVGQLWRTDGAEAAAIGIDELDNTSRIARSLDYDGERLFAYRSVS
jgi:propanediol dehydratase large subunit